MAESHFENVLIDISKISKLELIKLSKIINICISSYKKIGFYQEISSFC